MNNDITLRVAGAADVPALHRLIVENLEAGHLLPRSIEDLERHAHRFVVADHDTSGVIGCGELAPIGDSVAEIRSLVVHHAFRGRHIGSAVVDRIATDATVRGFSTLCAFTHEPSHFVRLGFTIVPHIWVPEKIAHDCTSCALFRRCGQHAVTLALRAGVSLRPQQPAAVIHGGRTVAPRKLNVERLQAGSLDGRTAKRKERVPA
jgi:amino-acid N-acetyltransferase